MAKQPAKPQQDVPPSRRRWSSSDKVRILEEAMAPGATVLGVARKYGVSAVSIYAWRKALTGGDSGHDLPEPAGQRLPLSERRVHAERSRPQGGLLFSYGDVLASGSQRRTASAPDEDVVRGLERRVAELETRCRTLQGRIDSWEASRRNLGEVLRTIGSQLNLLAHFSETDIGRGEPEGA